MIVDAVYDFLCPWCFVGKRHFDLAVEQERPGDLTIRYHPFMLYSHFDRGGHDFLEFFRSKYGETLQVPLWDKVRSVARPVGIDFRFEEMTRGPASLDGHRIVRFAAREVPGSEGALIEKITSGFYEEARIVDDDFLAEKAAEVGADPDRARDYLASDAEIGDLFRETEEWRAAGVTSMPHYILDDERGRVEMIKETSVQAFAAVFRRAGISTAVAA